MKRFYKSAAAVQTESGYMVNLDGRPVRTPARAPLVLPGLALGEAVAAEWNAQGDKIIPDTMPLMSFASTAIDRVSGAMEAVAAPINQSNWRSVRQTRGIRSWIGPGPAMMSLFQLRQGSCRLNNLLRTRPGSPQSLWLLIPIP